MFALHQLLGVDGMEARQIGRQDTWVGPFPRGRGDSPWRKAMAWR